MQSVVAGEVGECRMVDDEGTVGAGHRQRLPDQAVCLLDALAERVIASLVVCFVPFVEYGERLECISGYDQRVGGGVPDVRLHTDGLSMRWCVGCVMMNVRDVIRSGPHPVEVSNTWI